MTSGKKPPRPRARPLDPTEHADWEAVAQSIRPLKKKDVAPESTVTPEGPVMRSRGMLGPGAGPLGVHHPARHIDPPAPPPPQHGPIKIPPVEPRLLKDIRRGQVHIDATLDLHGETQARAYPMLERFLSVARTRGNRIILVITGSGVKRQVLSRPFEEETQPNRPAPHDIEGGFMERREPGVLKRALPQWLAAPPIRDWVVGYSGAAPHHGGQGAFYVVLRRAR